ncbi:saccharopine dehydrogenase family protein [Nocardia sp. NPDC057663]|uniref:saccharopine dehydrogenase family protein n=1 Tax=Nocardia sp. NPDC057663 TaxID=3346201 RepID=UPI003671E55C
MRVLALGGAGAMGAAAVRAAATLPTVTEIVVADRDLAAAQALAVELAGRAVPVRALRVDITDPAVLNQALHGADVVLNTVGPYYRFGPTVLQAAILTRTHYLDICDDGEPTTRMLELHNAAQKTGVCAIVGMGASPGVSNLLALTATRGLQRVEDLYTAWPVDVPESVATPDPAGPDSMADAAAVHWMQQISGTITVVRDGVLAEEAPLRAVTLDLPGRRRGAAYTVGHPEPITMQRTLSPRGEAVNLMVVTPGTAAFLDVLRTDIDRGKLTNETAAHEIAQPSLRRILRSLTRLRSRPSHGTLPPFFAAATGNTGTHDRSTIAYLTETPETARFLTDMARSTGIPLALGLAQLIDGTARKPGVHPPEAIIDSERFFRDLATRIGMSPAQRPVTVEHAPCGQIAGVGEADQSAVGG